VNFNPLPNLNKALYSTTGCVAIWKSGKV